MVQMRLNTPLFQLSDTHVTSDWPKILGNSHAELLDNFSLSPPPPHQPAHIVNHGLTTALFPITSRAGKTQSLMTSFESLKQAMIEKPLLPPLSFVSQFT